MVFQDYALFPHLTVRANVGFGGKARVDELLERFGLAQLADARPGRLSGGERQRVVLARALATEARLLLLDEPTANLDLAHQVSLLRLMQKKCKTGQASAVVITHDLNAAAEFADRILLLKRGKVVAAGKPGEVLTEENLRETFGVRVLLDRHPFSTNLRITTIY